MNAQMIRVISSPSSSTIGFLTSIFATRVPSLSFADRRAQVTATMYPVFGGGSIQFARVFGIRVAVDPSWFFVLFLIIWSLSGYYEDRFPDGSTAFVLAAVSALLFFLSVL